MNPLKVVAWIVAGIALVALVLVLAFAGTFVAYFVAALQRPPQSPFSIACTRLAAPQQSNVRVRFDIANAGRKDATWMNFALVASAANRRNLSDWGYVLETRVPAGRTISKVVAVPLPHDYSTVRFSGVQCNLINAVFADGSQQSYGAMTDRFP
ncbi:MAG: hypothetical protein JOY69_07660 [Candidatus Eremiobacteraeota bacterium]|nr:hypothetical protein [Candidatus Eremiobacteraeota bacterium]